ncbi:hypothetical protein M514_01681 [Trichuris suis]|uniref:Uncharacterized protein n=1 Tax=Trichuris suis TaxID=68888 RepID=A0A085N5X0_9BILA|nr:hypothetical protein M513_01681 [Trichuris suis]KFD64866.1 hypothetical protein M514_01681 [Trichuris suis]
MKQAPISVSKTVANLRNRTQDAAWYDEHLMHIEAANRNAYSAGPFRTAKSGVKHPNRNATQTGRIYATTTRDGGGGGVGVPFRDRTSNPYGVR